MPPTISKLVSGTEQFEDFELEAPKKKMVLGYWGIKGRAHTIRLLLEYLEFDYENKIYSAPD